MVHLWSPFDIANTISQTALPTRDVRSNYYSVRSCSKHTRWAV